MSGDRKRASMAPASSVHGVDVPNLARIHNVYAACGKNAYLVDRAAARALADLAPEFFGFVVEQDHRAFVRRAVHLFAEAGIAQFIEFGTGFPSAQALHEIARVVEPDARFVYSDVDPLVVVHGDNLLATVDGTLMIDADVRHPGDLFARRQVQALIDFTQPVAVLLTGLLHHVGPLLGAQAVISQITMRLSPGSYVAVSHAASVRPGEETRHKAIQQTLGRAGAFHPRTWREVGSLLDGLELLPPGLVSLCDWLAAEESGCACFDTPPGYLVGIGRVQRGVPGS